MTRVISFLVFWLLWGCTESDFSREKSSTSNQDPKISVESLKPVVADEPAMVAGSSLTCFEIDRDLGINSSLVACSITNAGLKIGLPLESMQVKLSLIQDDDDDSKPVIIDTITFHTEESPWHWSFFVQQDRVEDSIVLAHLSSQEFSLDMIYKSTILREGRSQVENDLTFSDVILSQSETGLAGGHIDVDTSTRIYPFFQGTTDGHVHSFDKKKKTNGVDLLNLDDGKLKELQSAIAPDQIFKLVVVNQNLSPGAVLTINGLSLNVVDFNRFVSQKTYSFSNDSPNVIALDELKLAFENDAILNNRVIATSTKCVRENHMGRRGEYRSGALTIQAVLPNSLLNMQTGSAISGFLWESSIFSHENECW